MHSRLTGCRTLPALAAIGLTAGIALTGPAQAAYADTLTLVTRSTTINVDASHTSAVATCPNGYAIVGGGVKSSSYPVLDSYPSSDTTWTGSVRVEAAAGNPTLTVYARCQLMGVSAPPKPC